MSREKSSKDRQFTISAIMSNGFNGSLFTVTEEQAFGIAEQYINHLRYKASNGFSLPTIINVEKEDGERNILDLSKVDFLTVFPFIPEKLAQPKKESPFLGDNDG